MRTLGKIYRIVEQLKCCLSTMMMVFQVKYFFVKSEPCSFLAFWIDVNDADFNALSFGCTSFSPGKVKEK
jgi:hypothetical protein